MSTRYRLVIWWHRKRTGHHTYMRSVADLSGSDNRPVRGVRVTCDCGKTWEQTSAS